MKLVLAVILIAIIILIISNKNNTNSSSRKKERIKSDSSGSRRTYNLRQGSLVETDDVHKAWTSGELEKMIKATNSKTNWIDRHYLIQGIVEETYKLRSDEKYRALCIKYSETHLNEFPSILKALKKDMPDFLPHILTFQNYATVLTEDGEFDKAIEVCEKAISYGLNDWTKTGYEGRIERIKKKMKK